MADGRPNLLSQHRSVFFLLFLCHFWDQPRLSVCLRVHDTGPFSRRSLSDASDFWGGENKCESRSCRGLTCAGGWLVADFADWLCYVCLCSYPYTLVAGASNGLLSDFVMAVQFKTGLSI